MKNQSLAVLPTDQTWVFDTLLLEPIQVTGSGHNAEADAMQPLQSSD